MVLSVCLCSEGENMVGPSCFYLILLCGANVTVCRGYVLTVTLLLQILSHLNIHMYVDVWSVEGACHISLLAVLSPSSCAAESHCPCWSALAAFESTLTVLLV